MSITTHLWATLTANGIYAAATPEQPPRPPALASFSAHVTETRNFVVGRKTFEAFMAQPSRGGDQPFGGVDIVVVTSRRFDGVTCVPSPRAAIELLRERGHRRALLAGGDQLLASALAEDLVDELTLVIAPVLAPRGYQLARSAGYSELELLGSRTLGENLVELRYRVAR